MAFTCSRLAEIEYRLYEKWKEKEETYDAIEAATSGLFSASSGMRAAIDSALSGIKGAFHVSEVGFAIDRSAPWRREIGAAKISIIKKQLNLMGIEPERVQELTDMGFTYEGLWGYRLICQNEQEKEFYIQILSGTEESYIKAFGISPYELNDGMTIFMADYASRLLKRNDDGTATEESVKQIKWFVNGVLSAEYFAPDQNGYVSDIKCRDVYLEKLCIGSQGILMGQVVITASADTNDWNYNELFYEYEKEFGMAMLWSTSNTIIQKLECTYEEEDQECSISNLYFWGSQPQFSINHYSPWNQCTVSEKISTIYIGNGNQNALNETSAKYKMLREKQETAYRNFWISIIANASIVAFGTISPEIAVAASIMQMGLHGTPGTVSGMDSITDNAIGKMGIKMSNSVIKDIVNYSSGISGIDNEIEALDYQIYLDWFGSGGKYTIGEGNGVLSVDEGTSLYGIYSPELLQKKMMWEEEGIDAWMDYAKLKSGVENRDDVFKSAQNFIIVSNESDSRTGGLSEENQILLEDVKRIIYGEKDMFETMSMERFNKAMVAIHEGAFTIDDQGIDAKSMFFGADI